MPSRNKNYRWIVPLKSTEWRNVSGFHARNRKVSAKIIGSIVHIRIELESHANTFLCESNCTSMHYTGK